MNGKAHLAVGGCVGIVVSQYIGADIPTTISFALLGSFVGLVPDLDVNGRMANRMTRGGRGIMSLLSLIGLLLIAASFILMVDDERVIGVGIGLGLLIISSIGMKQRTMLFIMGLLTLIAGIALSLIWLLMFGVYIAIASRLPHRSLTHSLIGLAYFSVIGYFLEQHIQVNGIMSVCIASYISHLVLDMKWIPSNKRGVKLLQPFSRFEI